MTYYTQYAQCRVNIIICNIGIMCVSRLGGCGRSADVGIYKDVPTRIYTRVCAHVNARGRIPRWNHVALF